MTNRITVVPMDESVIGTRHPVDGPLDAAGSLWAYDIFTIRLLAQNLIAIGDHRSVPVVEDVGRSEEPMSPTRPAKAPKATTGTAR